MNLFVDSHTGQTVGLSLKVMYSFFKRHPRFTEIAPGKQPDFFLCRHPRARVVSMFSDKCRARASHKDIQHCQHRIREATGKPAGGLSFAEFVDVLWRLVDLDPHFQPQHVGYEGCAHLIQIEKDLGILGNALALDLTEKQNASEHLPFELYYTRQSRPIVNELYRKDFEAFGYDF